MILHARQGIRGELIDLDTGEKVAKVISYDSERQEIEAYQVDAKGEIKRSINGDYLTYRARGRFQFRPQMNGNGSNGSRKVIMGAPNCTKCGSELTLLGNDLCAFCNALDKGLKGFKIEKVGEGGLLSNVACQKPYCGKPASYCVSDEVVVTPQLGKGIFYRSNGNLCYEPTGKSLYGRGATVARRWWCAWHYQPPRLLDDKGEVVEEFQNSVRP